MKKPILRAKRFSAALISSPALCAYALICLCWPAPAPHPMRYTSSLGGIVIFDGYVTPDTWCQVAAWEGTVLYKTQQVVYCQFKNLKKYSEKPLDTWGWVWYYDGGRRLCEADARPATTNTPGYPGVTAER